jgi:hypothetical protein
LLHIPFGLNGFCLNSVHPLSLAPTGDVLSSVALSNGDRSYPPPLREMEPDDEDAGVPRDGGRSGRSGIIGLACTLPPFVARRGGGGGGAFLLCAPAPALKSSLIVDRRAIGGGADAEVELGAIRCTEEESRLRSSSSSSATLLIMLAASDGPP